VDIESGFIDKLLELQDVIVNCHVRVFKVVSSDGILCLFLSGGIKEPFIELSEEGDPYLHFIIYSGVQVVDPISYHLGPSCYIGSMEEHEGKGHSFDGQVEASYIGIESDVSLDSFNKVFCIFLVSAEYGWKVAHWFSIRVNGCCGLCCGLFS
jgi:hypothetical protein